MGSIHNPFALLDDDSDSESPVVAPIAKEQPKKKAAAAAAAKKPANAKAASSSRAPKHGGKDRHSASGRKTDGARKGGNGPHGFGNKNSTTKEHIAEANTASDDKPRRERRERKPRDEEQTEQEPEEPEGKSYDEYLKERNLVDSKTESRGVNEGSFKGIKSAKVAEVVYDFDEEEEMFRIKDSGSKKKRKARKEKKNLAAELLPGLSGARREERPARREFDGERRGNSGRGRGGSGRGRGGSRGGRGGSRGGASRGGGNSSRPSSKGFNALASNERDFPSLGK